MKSNGIFQVSCNTNIGISMLLQSMKESQPANKALPSLVLMKVILYIYEYKLPTPFPVAITLVWYIEKLCIKYNTCSLLYRLNFCKIHCLYTSRVKLFVYICSISYRELPIIPATDIHPHNIFAYIHII